MRRARELRRQRGDIEDMEDVMEQLLLDGDRAARMSESAQCIFRDSGSAGIEARSVVGQTVDPRSIRLL
ncbi:hypothetical protein Y032_0044g975 [Ancylostoma ceylanicum]|uniref:Uncharacterized protein n=1 Tax=Ancylostoma ceylanicum TaxID=53326 RepID=A0A016UFL8_9BILA|nr:hypothetical protein Y032_0044g975 [Ancylostoma ceylanicum]